MTDEQFAALLKRLDQLTNKLGDGAGGLWNTLLAQAPIDGWVTILFFAVVAAAGYGVVRMWRWALKEMDERAIPALIVSGLYSIFFVCSLVALPTTIAA